MWPRLPEDAPEDRSGEDRTLVVVHVDADCWVTSPPSKTFPREWQTEDVPAGTSNLSAGRCVIYRAWVASNPPPPGGWPAMRPAGCNHHQER